MLELGDIIIMNNKAKGFYRWAIRLVTGKPYTHTAVGIGDIAGINSIFEADLCMATTPTDKTINDPLIDYEIYYVNVPETFKAQMVSELYKAYAGDVYGFLQLPWYLYRRIALWFGVDIKGHRNWFTGGEVCSEMEFYYLMSISNFFPKLKTVLDTYTSDTASPGDIADIIHMFEPEIFIRK